MFYIEPGLPHEVFNCSDIDWVEAPRVPGLMLLNGKILSPYDRDSE